MFVKWVAGKRSLKELSIETGKSIGTLRGIFNGLLEQPPKPNPAPNSKAVLLIDGTWFRRTNCLVVYYDSVLNRLQWWRYTDKENSDEIADDLKTLKESGVTCIGVVTDGGKPLIKGVTDVYPTIPKQRCLVHLQRLSLIWLTRKPRTDAGMELRTLCLLINKIKTKRLRNKWLKMFDRWNHKYSELLKEKTFSEAKRHWWYTHKSLRKVRRYLLNAIENMFAYLDNAKIPKDTNALEGGIFAPLKESCRIHRGVSKLKKENFLAWYLYLKYQNND